MANPTTNYGFVLPTSSDLVTDLPADFDVALQGVDTRLKALQPGTTLGDLAYSSATANMNTRLPVGTNGQVLSVVAGVPAWQNGTTGDITGVAVTSPITGGGTSGDVTIGISSSAVVPTQTGNSGKYLTTDGTTSSWGTVSAGGMTLIATATPSAATTFSFSSIPSTYKHLMVVVPELVWGATGNNMTMKFATGNYYSTRTMGCINNAGSFNYTTERGETSFGASSGLLAPIQKGYTSSGVFGDISTASVIWLYNYTATIDRLITWQAAGNGGMQMGTGIYDHNVAIDNITFTVTNSTVTGTAYLYGVS